MFLFLMNYFMFHDEIQLKHAKTPELCFKLFVIKLNQCIFCVFSRKEQGESTTRFVFVSLNVSVTLTHNPPVSSESSRTTGGFCRSEKPKVRKMLKLSETV